MAPSLKKLRRMKRRLISTVPPLHFYDFSRKESYFINHPTHLMPDVNSRAVRLIGTNKGYLIYYTTHDETWEDDDSMRLYQHFNDFGISSSKNNILYFYNLVNGSHFSLPPAPVFLRNKVVINISSHYDNVTVAAVCYNENADEFDDDGQKSCIAVIRTCDSEWSHFDLREVIGDDFVEDINDLREVIGSHFDNINDPTFSSDKLICMENPVKHLVFVMNQVKQENWVKERLLVESPDGKVLILYINFDIYFDRRRFIRKTKVFKHDSNQGRWDLVEGSTDLSFFQSFLEGIVSVICKSQSHLVASPTFGHDRLTGYDVHGNAKRLNIPDNFQWFPWLLFTPNLP